MQLNSKKYSNDHDDAIENIFQEMLTDAKNAYVIPREAFDKYHVKRGLREMDGSGVRAGVTKVGNVHGYIINEGEKTPDEGTLEYRGYEISELVGKFVRENRFGFEECAYLLFFGYLPTREELAHFNELLASYRRLPPRFTEDIIMKAPSRSIMNKMATSVLSLYSYDDDPDGTDLENMLHQSMEIVARLPVIAAQSYAVYQNAFMDESLNIHNPLEELSTAENFLRVLRPDSKYTDEEAKLLDIALVIHAEHGGGNCSTFTCRTLSSSGTDTYSAIAAAIGALKGPRHGGANIKVQEMFDCIKENVVNTKADGEDSDFLLKLLRKEAGDRSGLIYGMGHAIYTKSDPRAVMLKQSARKLAYDKGFGDDFELLERIERLTPELFNSYKGTEKDMCANVDLYSGLVYRMLGIPTEMYTPLFAVARVAGWCAHRMEEYCTSSRIIRPGYKCISKSKKFVAIDDRI